MTLEDILFITGLPIKGKAAITNDSKDPDGFLRVFEKGPQSKKGVTTPELKGIVNNKNSAPEKRLTALLMIVVASFIIPSADGGHTASGYLQFVENIEEVNHYAWGAALLAFLQHGLKKYCTEKKKSVDGNLWFLLCFFLIRIPKLSEKYDCKIELDGVKSPLMDTCMEGVEVITHKDIATLRGLAKEALNGICENDIQWQSYHRDMLDGHLRGQLSHVTLLAPIFCMNYVVLHEPHKFKKQFVALNNVDVSEIKIKRDDLWRLKIKKFKSSKSGQNQKFMDYYKNELNLWKKGKLVQDYIKSHTNSPSNADEEDNDNEDNDHDTGNDVHPEEDRADRNEEDMIDRNDDHSTHDHNADHDTGNDG